MKLFSQKIPFFKNDHDVAKVEEDVMLPILQKAFDDDQLEHTDGTFDLFDYWSPTRSIELKRRYMRKNTYPDTMIGMAKIDFASQHCHEREFIFVFRFNDGAFFWRFDPAVQLRIGLGGRVDRGVDERQDYYFVPIDLLLPIV